MDRSQDGNGPPIPPTTSSYIASAPNQRVLPVGAPPCAAPNDQHAGICTHRPTACYEHSGHHLRRIGIISKGDAVAAEICPGLNDANHRSCRGG
jgi:hypothetical protein